MTDGWGRTLGRPLAVTDILDPREMAATFMAARHEPGRHQLRAEAAAYRARRAELEITLAGFRAVADLTRI